MSTGDRLRDFESGPDFVQSLARGLSVLRVFNDAEPRLSLAAVAARAGLSRAAARRLVLTLNHLGFVRADGREFTLTPRVLELGFGFLGSLRLSDVAQPLMEDLSHQIGESCSMAVLDGHSIVYVARIPVRKVMTVSLGVGARLPAFCTSMGRSLLSGLSETQLEAWLQTCQPVVYTPHTVIDRQHLSHLVAEVRDQGFAYVEQELELGLCSVAVPLRNRQGQVAAALNVGMRFGDDARRRALDHVVPALRETAAALERCIPPDWLPPVSGCK